MTETNALMVQPVQTEIMAAINSYEIDLEQALLPLTPVEQACYLRDSTRYLDTIFLKSSEAMMKSLWIVQKNGLWTIPIIFDDSDKPFQCDSFRDWVDKAIGPTFHKRNDDRPHSDPMVQDIVRVVERTLVYAMRNSVKDAKGEIITPEYLIEEVGFAKLKITSSHFVESQGSKKKNELLKDLTLLSSSKLRKKYTTPRIPAIHAATNINVNGTADMLLMGLSANMVGLIRTALGETSLVEHQIHLRGEDRDALLTLLPPDAQKQIEEDIASERQDEVA